MGQNRTRAPINYPHWKIGTVFNLGVGLVLWLCALGGSNTLEFDNDKPRYLGEVERDLAAISRKYQIEVMVANSGTKVYEACGLISGKPVGITELREYAPLFMAEFNLYPSDLLHRVGLKRVVLCKELRLNGQPRSAIPHFDRCILYLDTNPGEFYAINLREVIHHDFYHMIDFAQCGLRDDVWKSLNPAGFKYGTGGAGALCIPTTGWLTRKYPGFLNHYSTTAVEEDKAEIFAKLMVIPNYVERRAAADKVLRTKIKRLKDSLQGFCPKADDSLWENSKQLHRPLNMVWSDASVIKLLKRCLMQPLPIMCILMGGFLLTRRQMRRSPGRLLVCLFVLFVWVLLPVAQMVMQIWLDYTYAEPPNKIFANLWPALGLCTYLLFIFASFPRQRIEAMGQSKEVTSSSDSDEV